MCLSNMKFSFILTALVAVFGYFAINQPERLNWLIYRENVALALVLLICMSWIGGLIAAYVNTPYEARKFAKLEQGAVYRVISYAEHTNHRDQQIVVLWVMFGNEFYPVEEMKDSIADPESALAAGKRFKFESKDNKYVVS